MSKKKFSETKIGAFLKDKAPKVLEIVGDVLPDKGVLGIVKNLIDKDPDIPAEQKVEFEKMLMQQEKELYELEVKDRDSARTREAEVTKSLGHIDYITYFLCGAGIAVFFFIVWHLVKENMPDANRELLYHTIGIIEGIIISIYSYYFGSSAGSRVKDMKLKA
jgi:hypothetical protein